MTAGQWKTSFLGFLAAVFAITIAVHIYILLAIKAETGVFEHGLVSAGAIRIFLFEYAGVAMFALPLWLVMAAQAARRAKSNPAWFISFAAAGTAAMMLAVFFATYDAQYYAQFGRWINAIIVFVAAIAAGALGGFTYWLTVVRNTGNSAK